MKRFLVLIALLVSSLTFSQASEKSTEFDPAFVYVVYFWLKNPENQNDRKEFEEALNILLENSLYTKTNFVGMAPKATREVVDDSFTYCLIVTFESAEAQENYQTEAAHLKFIEDAKHLWNKVVVYDALEKP